MAVTTLWDRCVALSEKKYRSIGIVIAVLAGFTLLVGSSVGGYMSGMMGMRYGWRSMAFLPFAVGGTLVVGYLFLTELMRSGSASTTARGILNTRYARGEITRELYLQMKHKLDP